MVQEVVDDKTAEGMNTKKEKNDKASKGKTAKDWKEDKVSMLIGFFNEDYSKRDVKDTHIKE